MIKILFNLVKHKLFKIISVFAVVFFLGWSISSSAGDDIKSATNNFSAMGIVSSISENGLEIKEAKGSDGSDKTKYDLNIENLKIIETNKKIPLSLTDIKEGDQVIVQGLTKGSSFFIKRIISFTSTPAPMATTTEDVVANANATESDTSSSTKDLEDIDEGVSVENSMATTSLATSTENSTTSEVQIETENTNSTTTATITDTETSIVDAIIETVIETVKDVVKNIVDSVTDGVSTQSNEVISSRK